MRPYTLGEFLVQEMTTRRMSEREFALFIGVNNATINRTISGEIKRPSLDFLEKIAARTKIDLASLVALSSPGLARISGISPRARILAQRIDQLPQPVQDLLDATVIGQHLSSNAYSNTK